MKEMIEGNEEKGRSGEADAEIVYFTICVPYPGTISMGPSLDASVQAPGESYWLPLNSTCARS